MQINPYPIVHANCLALTTRRRRSASFTPWRKTGGEDAVRADFLGVLFRHSVNGQL